MRRRSIPETTLLMGMSSDSDNQSFWRGIAHHGGFYDKDYVHDIGEQVMSHFSNFRKQTSPLWRARMPEITKTSPASRPSAPPDSGHGSGSPDTRKHNPAQQIRNHCG